MLPAAEPFRSTATIQLASSISREFCGAICGALAWPQANNAQLLSYDKTTTCEMKNCNATSCGQYVWRKYQSSRLLFTTLVKVTRVLIIIGHGKNLLVLVLAYTNLYEVRAIQIFICIRMFIGGILRYKIIITKYYIENSERNEPYDEKKEIK